MPGEGRNLIRGSLCKPACIGAGFRRAHPGTDRNPGISRFRLVRFLLVALLPLASCKLPTVNVATPEPIKVDVNMRLNIYQYRGEEKDKPDEAQVSYEEAVVRQRNRMAEVQTLKNNRLVGEDHRGMLHLREKPAGDWGSKVEDAVDKENEDRMILIRHEAKESNKQVHQVEAAHWKANIEKAFKGEWIEVPGDKPDTFKWIQAAGPKGKGRAEKKP